MERRIKVFLDTNVLLDVLSENPRPYTEASANILQAIRNGYLEGEITTQSFMDAYYILSGGKSNPELSRSILSLMNYVNVGSIDSFNVRDAIRTPKGDFEDDAQFSCALEGGCDAIVTADKKFIQDYNGENKHVWLGTPEEFLAKLQA